MRCKRQKVIFSRVPYCEYLITAYKRDFSFNDIKTVIDILVWRWCWTKIQLFLTVTEKRDSMFRKSVQTLALKQVCSFHLFLVHNK